MRRLPSLPALRAFEAAARHGSFKHAAEELAVTPTAISHQIRKLEDALGISLFERRTRQVVLTHAGTRLFPVLRDGFDDFAREIDALTSPERRAQVTISATPAFTSYWFMPRIAALREIHPDIDLHIRASEDIADPGKNGVDLAIRYGDGQYPDFRVVPLFDDGFAPLANPILDIRSVEQLASVPLIEFQWRNRRADNPSWTKWFKEVGIENPPEPSLTFSDESHAIQAAIAGQGVALLSLTLMAGEVEAGRVVKPFGQIIPSYRYSLLMASDARVSTAVSKVADWIVDQADRTLAQMAIG